MEMEKKIMQGKRWASERDVSEWIKRYDETMEKRTQELIELQTEFAKAQEKVNFYTEEITRFEAERKEREEKERLLREAKEKEDQLREKIRKGVTRFQALWRGYITRKRLKNKEKSGSKKGAKKGAAGSGAKKGGSKKGTKKKG